MMTSLDDMLTQATRHHHAGNHQAAEELYRAILQEAPAEFQVWQLLGAVCQAQGKLSEAAASLAEAARLNPSAAEIQDHLGVLLAQQGRLDESLPYLQAAVRLNEKSAEAQTHLGIVLAQLAWLPEAVACFQQAVMLAPGSAAAQFNLGNALSRQGRPIEAAARFQQALRLNPASADAHHGLGTLLSEQGRFEEALSHLREVVRLRPNDPEAHRNLANTLQMHGELDEAAASCREALRLRSDYAEPHNCLGAVLTEKGQFPEAIAQFQEALALKPDLAMPYLNLADLARQGQYQFQEQELDRMRELLRDDKRSLNDRSALHYALAYALDKQKAYDEAFSHLDQANELKKRHLLQRGKAFVPENHRLWTDLLIATFTPEYFERVASFGSGSELPIFIVGVPRSGTTMMAQIISSHPQMAAAGELTDVQQMVDELPRLLRTSEPYPGCMSTVDRDTVHRLAERYLQRLGRIGPGAVRIADKMPENFFHLGLIATLFPQARIIHCRRDPLDVCLSCYMQDFRETIFSSDLRDLGAYYRQYDRLMAHWKDVLPLRMLDARYEDFVANQEAASRELIAFCGLAWNDRCLAFHENSQPVRTASRVQVRQPMYATAVGRWKRYEKHLGPLKEALGS
jgi:tetratricopeptide (TPR) repeat protein